MQRSQPNLRQRGISVQDLDSMVDVCWHRIEQQRSTALVTTLLLLFLGLCSFWGLLFHLFLARYGEALDALHDLVHSFLDRFRHVWLSCRVGSGELLSLYAVLSQPHCNTKCDSTKACLTAVPSGLKLKRLETSSCQHSRAIEACNRLTIWQLHAHDSPAIGSLGSCAEV